MEQHINTNGIQFTVPISGSVTCQYHGDDKVALIDTINLYKIVKQSDQFKKAKEKYENNT
jgi:hypothetical protein